MKQPYDCPAFSDDNTVEESWGGILMGLIFIWFSENFCQVLKELGLFKKCLEMVQIGTTVLREENFSGCFLA